MRIITARHAKNAFGFLIDEALVEPVAISKHGRPIVVVLAYGKFQQLVDRKRAERTEKGRRPRKTGKKPA